MSVRLEQSIRSFEAAMRNGDRPRIEDWLKAAEPDGRAELLDRCLRIELQWKAERGEPVSRDDYLRRFPADRDRVIAAFRATRAAEATADTPRAGEDSLTDDWNQATVISSLAAAEAPGAAGDDAGGAVELPETQRHDEDTGGHDAARGQRLFGRYRVERELGRGGFGIVCRAWDEELHRAVAVKVTRAVDSAMPEDAFLQEARMVAGLDHPAIVPVYDVGRLDDGSLFVVSKLIDGETLATARPRVVSGWQDAVRLCARIADALHYAHTRGLVHRDVKPSNLLVDQQGNPYLTDFGIALHEDEVGRGPEVVGTLSYMSPEQVSGQAHRVDGRADIFGLGVVLYELLTGRRPFRADRATELIEQITTMDVRPPRQIDDSIPESVEAVCRRALAKPVADRFATAGDFAAALRATLASAAAETSGSDGSPAVLPVGRRILGFSSTIGPLGCSVSLAMCLLIGVAGSYALQVLRSSVVEQIQDPLTDTIARHSPDDERAPVDEREPPMALSAVERSELIRDFSVLVSRNDGAFRPVEGLAPIRNGDAVRFSIRLAEPAYARLLWIDADGQIAELFPNDPETGLRTDGPVEVIESPQQLDRGWPVLGSGGLETALLLVNRTELPKRPDRVGMLSGESDPETEVRRYSATREADPAESSSPAATRSLGPASQPVNDRVMQLLEMLRQDSDVVRAVTIPHGDDTN